MANHVNSTVVPSKSETIPAPHAIHRTALNEIDSGPAHISGGAPAAMSGGARCGLPCATGVSTMPDGSMTNLANTRISNDRRITIERRVSHSVTRQIWERAEKIDRELFQANIAFGMVFGILEDAGAAALKADADPVKEGWQIKYLLSNVDQLHYLLGDIHRRCKLIKGAKERILELSSRSAEPDPVEALAEACLLSEEAYDAPRPSSTGEEEKKLEEAMCEAAERLTAHRTVTPLGILRKLEYAARVECFERDLQDNPNLAVARIVMGLINDLKQSLDLK